MRWKSYKELPEGRFRRAEIHKNTLWLQCLPGMYENKGRLFSIDLEKKRVVEAIPHHGYVKDFYVQPDGIVFAITSYETADELWVCKNNEWNFVSKIYSYLEKSPGFDESEKKPRPRLIKIFACKKEIIVLSVASIMRYPLDKKEWKQVSLSEYLSYIDEISVAITSSGMIYLGYYYGEFGGKLIRISIETGQVEDLEWAIKMFSKLELFGQNGEIQVFSNTYSMPVTGIIVNPLNPDKIIYSLGLQHCGFDDGGIFHLHETDKELILGNLAVKQLKSSGRSYYAASYDSLLEFKDGEHRKLEFGEIFNVGGVYISMPAPGVAAILPGVNYATSWSDLRPLLAVEMNRKNIYD